MAVEPGFEKFFRVFYKLRWVSLVLWVAITAVGAYFGVQFLGLTNARYDPPVHSEGMRDKRLYERFFGNRSQEGRIVILLGAVDPHHGPDVHTDNWANISSHAVMDAVAKYPGGSDFVTRLVGRYTWSEEQLKQDPIAAYYVEQAFFGPENRSTIMLMSTREEGNTEALDFARYLRGELARRIDTRNGTLMATALGVDTIVMDTFAAAENDMKVMDMVALPIALVVLVVVVRSSIVMLVPIAAVGATVAASFGVMYGVASRWDVPAFCPAVMMSIIVAMSIDYSLFMLTRFHEEIMRGHGTYTAVMNTLRHSGQTIATSGIILSICVLSMAFFPVNMVVMIGISGLAALLSTLVTALWLTPTLLLIGGRVFRVPGVLPCIRSCRTITHRTKRQIHDEEVRGRWFRFTRFTTQLPHALLVILVIVVLLVPVCLGLLKFYTVTGLAQSFPRGSETQRAYNRFSEEWPIGMLESFDIIAVPTALLNSTNITEDDLWHAGTPQQLDKLLSTISNSTGGAPTSVFTQEYFDVSLQLIQALLDTGGVDSESLLSISRVAGTDLDLESAESLLEWEFAYQYVFDWLTNPSLTATRITVSTTFDPNMDTANVTDGMLRPILHNFTANTNFTFALVGAIVGQADSAVAALDDLPYVLSAALIVIGIAAAAIYRSVVLPLRMVVTIVLTVAWTYGLMSLIFCSGWFDWIDAIARQPGLNWVVPNLSVFMCIGLALDYDIFLFTRVREFRLRGWSNRAAVVKGVARTGRVITFAGVIMAIAFSGLAASSLMLLDQFAYVLMFSVLLDTFVIRTTLNPAIIYLCGNTNYECCLPPPKYDDPTSFHPEAEDNTDDFDDDLDSGDGGAAAADDGDDEQKKKKKKKHTDDAAGTATEETPLVVTDATVSIQRQ